MNEKKQQEEKIMMPEDLKKENLEIYQDVPVGLQESMLNEDLKILHESVDGKYGVIIDNKNSTNDKLDILASFDDRDEAVAYAKECVVATMIPHKVIDLDKGV